MGPMGPGGFRRRGRRRGLVAGAMIGSAAARRNQDSQETNVPSQPASQDNQIDELKELAGLRDSGILTEDEFQAKKAQILGI
jgi:hypothetical protein